MSTLSTHVLDTAEGRPAAGMEIILERAEEAGWVELARGITNEDGRAGEIAGQIAPATYRLTFLTGAWADGRGGQSFYPRVPVVFTVTAADEHYHVPLLVSPYGYSTYRGS